MAALPGQTPLFLAAALAGFAAIAALALAVAAT